MLTDQLINDIIDGTQDPDALIIHKKGKLYLKFDQIQIIIGKKDENKNRSVIVKLFFNDVLVSEKPILNSFKFGDIINLQGLSGISQIEIKTS